MPEDETVVAFIDGASSGNPGPAGAGIVLKNGDGESLASLAVPLGETTNNVAEYLALLYCLQEAQRRGLRRLAVRTDSELLARQFNGQYKVRDGTLRLFHQFARYVATAFERLSVEHIGREFNAEADRLARRAARQLMSAASEPDLGSA
ncbi:MAG: ribonuclease HI family protein [Candidatus Omnitrophica bacterium]|nr:ribonuclease HI family protein [Candidatus Omnitrophota bacterium]